MSHPNSAKKKNHQPVKVYIRQRPFNEQELASKCFNIVQHMTSDELIIKFGLYERKYGFDQVFGEETSQKEVYNSVVAPLISSIIAGYNCTVFAYGQTGTGKTYTMIGKQAENCEGSSVGLIPRSASHLFDELERIDSKIEHTVRISFIEIYNEEVRDLLSNSNIPLKIFDDPDNKGSVCIRNVKEATVFNLQEVCDWLNLGLAERQTAATNMNRHSSRSHSIFTLSILTRQLTLEGDELIKNGKLYLVDLAGSENLGRSGSTEMRAREAGNINKSLLTLGKVIKALAQKTQHVPYRDSKLTRILQDSLGGKTKTCMIATISSAGNVYDETISTLDYAQVARNVSNCPQVNENRKQANILKDLKDEIGRLRKELAVARAGEGFYMSVDNYEKLCADLERLRKENEDRMKKLEEVMRENEKKEQLMRELSKSYESVKEELRQKDLEIQRNDFLLDYFEKREKEMRTASEQLWKVCEISTKHETLFCQKYENQCQISMKNAATAKKAYSIFDDSFKMLQNVTKDHVQNQNTSLNEVGVSVGKLKENAWKMCRRLTEYSKKIQDEGDEELIKLDEAKFDKSLDVSRAFDMQKKALDDLETYNRKKMEEMENMTTRCMNSVKQLLNDYTLCVNDVMKTESLLIRGVKDATIDGEVNLNQSVNEYKEKSDEFFKNFVSNVNRSFVSRIQEAKQVTKQHFQEIEGIKDQFTTESENKVNNIVLTLKTVENNQNSYENAIRALSGQILERIKKELDDNIQHSAHVGDTPVKQNYKYPRLEEGVSKSTLYRLFESSTD